VVFAFLTKRFGTDAQPFNPTYAHLQSLEVILFSAICRSKSPNEKRMAQISS